MRIVISGTVGIGKSTTTEALVKKLKAKNIPIHFLKEETVDSIYLEYYYKKPEDWAFVSQLDFLFGRFKQFLQDEKSRLENKKNKNLITVYDRHFLDDYVFAELHTIKKNISSINSITYQAIYKELLEKMNKIDAKPDYFILLKAPIEEVMGRLRQRGRNEEKEVDMEYWKDLYNNYYVRPMFKNHFKSNVKNLVEIDTTNKKTDAIVEEIIKIIKLKK